ncbi:hypothetical protein H310_09161 [Aphanomyces invadans]|uniref:Uncharacterized protein n=1 Tax=Aphanomyces invadans TaxID=157072 RepID=A0A024TWS7_9STRA|nr:hypothetical protein H310_09161 [Aphanomyces invadans]ETV97812.1 hypothetical protein H310_09161 [Aphanomyces invadans]|eukprot:XP_008873373.1 hypothetical protein H310_09161 [Aphanomyces invadans]
MPSKPGTGDPSMAHGVHQRLQRLGSTKMMDKAMESTSRSKERTTSMSRNGSLHVVPKGTKHSVSVRKPMKGHPDVELLMADVFAEMDRQRQRGQIKFPSKFADFFHHDMMVEFVKACMQLADTFVAVQHLELAIALHSPPSPPATVNSPLVPPSIATMPDSERTLAYHKAVANHSDSVANLAKWYSRVVLNCSNFERHEEDRTFFEAVYYFVCAIVKTTHPPDTWPLIEEELGYAFRGEVFNVHGKSNLQPPMAPEPAKVSATRFGQPTTAHHAPDPLAGDLKFSPRAAIAYGSYGQNISLASIVARVDATTSRAEHNVKVSQAMRDRIHGQRNEDHKARRQLGKSFAFPPTRPIMCFQSVRTTSGVNAAPPHGSTTLSTALQSPCDLSLPSSFIPTRTLHPHHLPVPCRVPARRCGILWTRGRPSSPTSFHQHRTKSSSLKRCSTPSNEIGGRVLAQALNRRSLARPDPPRLASPCPAFKIFMA